MKNRKKYQWIGISLGLLAVLIGVILFQIQFKGKVERVSFNSDIRLEGVLITPDTPGPHPAILLLHGAGSSHQTYDKLFFRFHANAFLAKGFAVLVYTKRGSGDHDFNYRYFTYEHLMKDAEAAIGFLRQREDIDQENIGLMGVSESGWFTPELAFRDKKIKFIINRVSSPFSVRETVIHEVEMDALSEGFTQEEVDEIIVPLTQEIWQFYEDSNEDAGMTNGPARQAINAQLARHHKDERLGKWFTYNELEPYNLQSYEATAKRLMYDPMPYVQKLDIPMFYVMAGKDKNIPTAKVVYTLNELRTKYNKEIQIKVYPEASHYLYKYGLEDGPFEGWLYQDDYLETLTSWASNQLN